MLPSLPVTINAIAEDLHSKHPKLEDRLVKAVDLISRERIRWIAQSINGEPVYECRSSNGEKTYTIARGSCTCAARKLCYHRIARGLLVIQSANLTEIAFGDALAQEEASAPVEEPSSTTQAYVQSGDHARDCAKNEARILAAHPEHDLSPKAIAAYQQEVTTKRVAYVGKAGPRKAGLTIKKSMAKLGDHLQAALGNQIIKTVTRKEPQTNQLPTMNEVIKKSETTQNALPIRTTPDGKWMSVFDLVKGIAEDSNPHRVWEKGSTELVELLGENLKEHTFPGQGQRPTPTVNREGFVVLLRYLLTSGRLPQDQSAKLWEISAQRILQPLPSSAPVAQLPDPNDVATLIITGLANWSYKPAQDFLCDHTDDSGLADCLAYAIPRLEANGGDVAKRFLNYRKHHKDAIRGPGDMPTFIAWLLSIDGKDAWYSIDDFYDTYQSWCFDNCLKRFPKKQIVRYIDDERWNWQWLTIEGKYNRYCQVEVPRAR
jgi:uncharacterized lipoprotein YbaY